MKTFINNKARQNAVKDFISEATNKYLIFSLDSTRSTADIASSANATIGSINGGYIEAKCAIKIIPKYAIRKSSYSGSVTEEVSIAGIDYVITDDISGELDTEGYWTSIYFFEEVAEEKIDTPIEFNVVSLVTNPKDGIALLEDDFITSFTALDLSESNFIAQARPANTTILNTEGFEYSGIIRY